MTRRVTIHTPLGEQLHFRELRGQENISQLFSLDVEMLSESESIDPKALLGKNATIEIETQGGGRRFIDGIVTRFGMQGQDHRHYAYKARLSRSEEHTSELQSQSNLVCRLLLEKK